MYDLIIYNGRFQPFHNIHLETIKRASAMAKEVAIIVGSAYQPSTFKNPWSAENRAHGMISPALKDAGLTNCNIHFNYDSIYNTQAWSCNSLQRSRTLHQRRRRLDA